MPQEKSKAIQLTYTVYFLPVKGNGYLIMCPAIPGLTNTAKTVKEARKVARKDIKDYLVVLKKEGLPPPKDKDWIIERVTVTLTKKK